MQETRVWGKKTSFLLQKQISKFALMMTIQFNAHNLWSATLSSLQRKFDRVQKIHISTSYARQSLKLSKLKTHLANSFNVPVAEVQGLIDLMWGKMCYCFRFRWSFMLWGMIKSQVRIQDFFPREGEEERELQRQNCQCSQVESYEQSQSKRNRISLYFFSGNNWVNNFYTK